MTAKFTVLAFAAFALMFAVFLGQAQAEAPVAWSADELKWTEMGTGPIKTAVLWGDMNQGAYGAMVKFPAGLMHPLHTHSADIRMVVVSGTFLYQPKKAPQKKFGPGSYLLVPANAKHASGCAADADCICFMEQSAKFDMTPVEKK